MTFCLTQNHLFISIDFNQKKAFIFIRDSEKTHSPIILYLTQRRRGAKEKRGKLTTEPFFATLRLCEIFGVIRFF